jgi:DNA-binding CsgD family transcriptional regulator
MIRFNHEPTQTNTNKRDYKFVGVREVRGKRFLILFSLLFSLFICANAFGQVSRTDEVDVFYYDSLHEAVSAVADNAAAAGTSIDQPDEITLLADLVLDAPLTLDDGKHIRLVAGGSDRTIRRGSENIEYPVIWVNGDSSSLTLGKPGMEYELIIDGGCLNSPPIEAHCPLVSVCGPGAKLIMYDKVTLQNNKNRGSPSDTSYYENGGGVFIRTQENNKDRQAEFIMKGGTIRGNMNVMHGPMASGGGVQIAGFGIFTMEGGIIMNNTSKLNGGGIGVGGRGSFTKTGGIIYGSNAPAIYRNTTLNGSGTPKIYAHAVRVSAGTTSQFRDDTVKENDRLSYTGNPRGIGIFGTGEKWDNPDKNFRRTLLAVILPVLALAVCVFLIFRKMAYKKMMKTAQEARDTAANAEANGGSESFFENVKLPPREKEIGILLLTELSMKQIATVMHIAYTTADYHAKKVYLKMGVQSRQELLIRVKIEKGKINK